MIDTERVFGYRILVISRNDKTTELFGYDDKVYADNVDVSNRTLSSLLDEFTVVRNNTDFLLRNLADFKGCWIGEVGSGKMSIRAMAYIILGHCYHHCEILKERY
jgi:hypothetical protein